MANMTTLNGVAKENYPDILVETVNDEADIKKWCEATEFKWAGRQLRIPVHTAPNTGVGAIPEIGPYPTAGSQGWASYTITPGIVGGSGTVTLSTIKGIKAGDGSALDLYDAEINRLIDDTVSLSNQFLVSGGPFKGILNQRQPSGVTAGAAPCVIAVPLAWEYFGEFTPFRNVVTANQATWVKVLLFDTVTLAPIIPAGGGGVAANQGIFVSAINETTCTLTLQVVSDVVGTAFTTILAGNVGWTVGLALDTAPPAFQCPAGVNFGTVTSFANEPLGFFSNLLNPILYTVDRTTATGTAVRLQSVHLANNITAAGQNRTAVIAGRVDRVAAVCERRAGRKYRPDSIWANPETESAYRTAVGVVAFADVAASSKGTVADGIAAHARIAGRDIMTSKDVPLGGYLVMKKGTWYIGEYDTPQLVGIDNILRQNPGTRVFMFNSDWEYAVFCSAPSANGTCAGTLL